VSAKGDAGRDLDTFRSYLKQELGPHSAFTALVSDGPPVFVCTLQEKAIDRKILRHVAKIAAGGMEVAQVFAMCSRPLAIGKRQELIKAVLDTHELELEVLDGEALAAHLARPDLFWVAEQYLDVPSELAPPDDEADLPQKYAENRQRWRSGEPPQPTIGDFLAIKRGLRHATFNRQTRDDLPFWLGLMRTLADQVGPAQVRQRARYEVAVAALRGAGDMRPADDLVREYLDEVSASEPSVARIVDAKTLLTYAFGAALRCATDLDAATLTRWSEQLRAVVESQLEEAPTANTRAVLLRTLGGLYLQPDLAGLELPTEPQPGPDPADDVAPADGVPWGGAAFMSLPDAIVAWLELARMLEHAPLFPVDSFSRELTLLTTTLVDHPDWRELTRLVDEALVAASGQAAAAARCRDRAVQLKKAGRLRQAVHEMHEAKVDWWSGDTFRGSLLAMLFIADCYQRLKLPHAAK
jgi:hypothetical protein